MRGVPPHVLRLLLNVLVMKHLMIFHPISIIYEQVQAVRPGFPGEFEPRADREFISIMN